MKLLGRDFHASGRWDGLIATAIAVSIFLFLGLLATGIAPPTPQKRARIPRCYALKEFPHCLDQGPRQGPVKPQDVD